jgi:hypothetical protein
MAGADEIQWARRVKPEKIRRLYTLDSKGILDDELIDEVGYAMYARCHSIRQATRAHAGKAMCPRCRADVLRSSADWKTWTKDEPLVCGCGWSTTWGAYSKSYQHKQLYGGQAYPMFRAFIDRWPAARTSRDKLLAIDWLIHACHGEWQGGMGRPAACNLIEGTATELVRFLNELAYGEQSTEEIVETRTRWDQGVEGAPWLKRMRDSDPKVRRGVGGE